MKKFYWVICILIIVVFASHPALAEENKDPDANWERFHLKLGGMLAAMDGNIRIGSGLGVGIDIDVEDTLGLDSGIAAFKVDAMYRFGGNKRSRVDLSFYQVRREATRNLQREITIGDETFPVGTIIDTLLDIQILRASYSYSLIRDDRIDIAVGGGLFIMPLEVKVTNTVTGSSGGETITAPLPVVNLRLDFAITPKWFIRQNVDFFYLEFDTFAGGITDITSALEYNPWKHIGFGLGFDFFRVGVESKENDIPGVDLNGNVKFNLNSVIFYARYFM